MPAVYAANIDAHGLMAHRTMVAVEIARYAQNGAGIFCGDDNQWFELRDGAIEQPC
jgi:hypothetical protein